MSVLRDHYYRLASEVPQERLTAATQLIDELNTVNNEEEWTYALNRLTKGLITTRQNARYGFSIALTEVIRELIEKEQLTIQKYLELLLEVTGIKSNMKGKEERAVLFGRLFGLQCLLNSGILYEKVDTSIYAEFIDMLTLLAVQKSWLRETTFFTILQFITQLKQKELMSDETALKILQSVNDVGLNLSTEGLSIYLSIDKEVRDRVVSKMTNTKPNWKNGDPLFKGNLATITKVLRDVEVVEDQQEEDDKKTKGNKKQKGSWSSRLPFVWDILISKFNELYRDDDDDNTEDVSVADSRKRKKSSKNVANKKSQTQDDKYFIQVKEFFKIAVDESLFSEKSSHERKYWGFEIFQKFLSSLDDVDAMEHLFTPNLMRCLINQSSQANRFLNRISVLTLQKIIKVAEAKPQIVPVVFRCLLDESKGGCWNFDLVTKSHTVEGLLSIPGKTQDVELASCLIKILISEFNTALKSQDSPDDNSASFKRSNDNILKWCLDRILYLIRHNRQIADSIMMDEILELLIRHAFFKSTVSSNIRDICQERLNSILAEIISKKRPMDGNAWSTYCFQKIQEFEKLFDCLLEFDQELLDIKNDTVDTLKTLIELKTKSKTRKEQLYCFELLFSMVLIQLYMEDEETIQVINELKLCFENQFNQEDGNEEVDSGMVLTEVILSFVSRKSSLLKKLSSIVWEHFLCGKDEEGKLRLNDESLKLLLDVLVAKENKEGQQKLFEGEDEFVDEDHDGEEEEDEETKESENASNDEDEEASSESDSDEDEDDDLAELDKETNLKLAKALGIPTSESGEVKFDELDSSSDDDSFESDSMDDEEMLAMDDQLSKIFKDRQDALSSIQTGNKRKTEVLQAKEQMIFFKNRILDLLDTFVKKQPNSHYNLSLIEPLIKLINLTLDKNVGTKAHKLLKTRISRTMVTNEELDLFFPTKEAKDVYINSLISLIKSLQKQANETKSSNQAVTASYNQSCIILAKNIVNIQPDALERILNIYTDSLKEWALDPKSKLQPSLFFDFINWINSKK